MSDPTTATRSARADANAAASDRRRGIALVAVLVVAAILGALVVWQGTRLAAARADADAGRQLRSQAGSIVAQVLSWNGMTLRADRQRARTLVTDSYAERSGLDAEFPTAITDSALTFSPGTVGVVQADATSGTVLIDGTLTRMAMGNRTPQAQTLTADFVARDGRWLLDRIDVVR